MVNYRFKLYQFFVFLFSDDLIVFSSYGTLGLFLYEI